MTTQEQSTPFPFVDFDQLLAHPKAGKREDLERILRSPQSEDWVTWNVLRAIQLQAYWWPAVVSLAQGQAFELNDSLASSRPPAVDLWRRVATPPAYEHASRTRMASSKEAEWRKRADIRKPVEGWTEVDAVLEGDEYLVFVEAKLSSDVSEHTKYDPCATRSNEISTVLSRRLPTTASLLDVRQGSATAIQVFEDHRRLRSDVRLLESRLPHRDPGVLAQMVKE